MPSTLLSAHRFVVFQEFHEDLSVKNKEMERLAVASTQQLAGDADAVGARVAILHNKWRTVWRLSVDRKKLLQDTYDHLQEVSISRYFFT